MICFTSDIDWAPDAVVKEMLDIFEEYNVKCTLFTTHESDVIKFSESNLFEVAIHPNFNNSLLQGNGRSAEDIIYELMEIYPNAKGVRSHSMTHATPLLNIYKKFHLKYESNLFIPYNYELKPYICWTGITRIPYNWEDDIHFSYGKSFLYDPFENSKIHIENGYFVFDFHPIHVFLNTDNAETYNKAKTFYHNVNELQNYRNRKNIGTRDFLISLLTKIKEMKYKTFKLSELVL